MSLSLPLRADIFTGLLYKNVSFNSINDFPIIVANVIEILLMLTAILAVIFIILAGIKYIYSQGNASQTENAKNTLRNAIIGVILASSAYLIVDYVARQFKG